MSRHGDEKVVTVSGTIAGPGGSDMRAAFTGLIAAVIALFLVVMVIVVLTNRSFEGHGAAPAGANPAATAPATPH